MKLALTSFAVVAMMATASFANGTLVGANADAFAGAESTSTSSAVTGSSFSGGSTSSVNIQQPDDITVRSAPDAFAPSFSSGHPCAYSPATFGVSIIGGGASAGGQKIDQACMLAQLGEKGAALALMAAKDPDVYDALVAAGRIAPRPAAVASTKSPSNFAPAGRALASCEFDAAGSLVKVVKRRGVDAADALAFCRGQ